MPKRRVEITSDDIPILPAFPSAAWDVTVIFNDDTTEIIKVLAMGQAAALRTASYTMERWVPEKIEKIVGVGVEKP